MAKILLIDDMKGVRRTLSTVLKRAGHDVVEADDGGVGVDLLKSQRFDLVITDMLMPQHDGMEVLLFLEQQPNRPKVLAISGGGSQVSADEAFMLARNKADATLAKPFDNSELQAAAKSQRVTSDPSRSARWALAAFCGATWQSVESEILSYSFGTVKANTTTWHARLWRWQLSPLATMISAAALVMVMVCAAAATLWNMHEQTDRDARATLGKLAMVIAEQTSRSIQSVDLVLGEVVARITAGGVNTAATLS
jgi:CheY-like chemotaxis protein